MSGTPSGFEPIRSKSAFNELVGPLYAQLRDDTIYVGLRLEEKHCNTSGRLHGAMVCALFDACFGHNVGYDLAKERGDDMKQHSNGVPGTPLVTVSLTTEYLGSARVGDWVEASAVVQRPGRSLAFVNGELAQGGERIAKGSAIFRVFSK